MKNLTSKEIQENLGKVEGWILKDSKIQKVFIFDSFVLALKFVNAVADLSEKENHHPDISIKYNKVEIVLWTHDIGGLSEKDFNLASKIDGVIN